MAIRYNLTAQPRTVTGKKTRFLRRQGIVPASVYGHGRPSQAVQVSAEALDAVLSRTAPATLIGLRLPGGSSTVVVREVQRDPRKGTVIHVDFHEVSLTEAIRAEIPVHLTGVSPAARHGEGALVQNLHTLEVEGLPTRIPPTINVDVSGLVALHESIYVRDLVLPRGVKVLSDGDDPVVSLTAAQSADETAVELAAEPARVTRERGEEV